MLTLNFLAKKKINKKIYNYLQDYHQNNITTLVKNRKELKHGIPSTTLSTVQNQPQLHNFHQHKYQNEN